MNASATLAGHQMAWASRTDVGKVRRVNEDSVFVGPGMFVVADGMGGHAAGDVASRLTIESFAGCSDDRLLPIAELTAILDRANASVLEHAQGTGRHGMGSTVVGLALTDNGGTPNMVVFHVGDSRCYVCEDGRLRQVTHDHSEVQEMVDDGSITASEAAVHPLRNVVTRAIGIEPTVTVDFVVMQPRASRRFLLCSDGVSGEVSFEAMEQVMQNDSLTPDEVAEWLMGSVLEGRAPDNASLVVVDVVGTTVEPDDPADVTGPRPRPAVLDATVVVSDDSESTVPWPPPVILDAASLDEDGISSRPRDQPAVIDDVPF